MKIFSSLDGHWMNIDLSSLADFKYWNVIKLRFDEKSEEEEATEKDALQMRMKLEISEIMVHQENLLRITSTELIGSMVDICWFSTSLTCFRFGRCITFVKILSPCMDVSLSPSASPREPCWCCWSGSYIYFFSALVISIVSQWIFEDYAARLNFNGCFVFILPSFIPDEAASSSDRSSDIGYKCSLMRNLVTSISENRSLPSSQCLHS